MTLLLLQMCFSFFAQGYRICNFCFVGLILAFLSPRFQEIAEPLFDLKLGMEQLAKNKTFKRILATLLAIGNFLNSTSVNALTPVSATPFQLANEPCPPKNNAKKRAEANLTASRFQ